MIMEDSKKEAKGRFKFEQNEGPVEETKDYENMDKMEEGKKIEEGFYIEKEVKENNVKEQEVEEKYMEEKKEIEIADWKVMERIYMSRNK